MPETIDAITLTLIATWTTAIVAGIRVRVPEVDGIWVLLVTVIAAAMASAMFLAPMPDWVRYALLGISGSIGGMSLADRFISKAKGPEK